MDDLISRQAAIAAINQICPIETEYGFALLYRVDVRCVLTDLPSAQPERKTGEWIEATADGIIQFDKSAYAECSVCGKKEFLGWRKNFCPNCGADMRGKEDE